MVTSRLLYVAPVWMARAQRVAALRITKCNRTVSTVVATFLTELPPADLLAGVRKRVRARKRRERDAVISQLTNEERSATMVEWQNRWTAESSVTGWLRQILPSVHRWVGRLPGSPVTFHLAQALTGHGAFNEYLHSSGSLNRRRVLIVRPQWIMWPTRYFYAHFGMNAVQSSRTCLAIRRGGKTSKDYCVGRALGIRKLIQPGKLSSI